MNSYLARVFSILLIFTLAQSALAAPSAGKVQADVTLAKLRSSTSTFRVPFKVPTAALKKNIEITVGAYHFNIPAGSFRSTGKTKHLVFKAAENTLGVFSAEFDPKRKLLTFKIRGVPLSSANFPIPVSVKSFAIASCTLFGNKGKPAAAKKSLSLSSVGRCSLSLELLSSTVGTLPLSQATATTFRLKVSKATNALAVYASDQGGAVGAKICDLVDNGNSATGDAVSGDNSYACNASVTPKVSAPLYFVARGKRAGASITFPGIALQVLSPITASDVSAGITIEQSALELWSALKGSVGDSDASRLEFIQQAMALPGVTDAVISPNGVDIELSLSSGLHLMLILNTKLTDSAAPRAFIEQSLASIPTPRNLSTPLEEISNTTGSKSYPRAGAAPTRVLLYDPGYFPATENETLRNFIKGADPTTVSFTDIKGAGPASDISVFSTLTNYDVILIDSHGSLDAQGRVGFVAPLDPAKIAGFSQYLASGQVKLCGTDNIGPGISHDCLMIMPDFISANSGQFNGTTVIASSCYSLANNSMADAFSTKGAAGYLGYDNIVSAGYASDIAGQFLCSGIIEGEDNGQSFDLLSPKVDPNPGTDATKPHAAANVKYNGSASARLGAGIQVKNLTPAFNPSPLLLFEDEKYSQDISLGAAKLPPCLKYRLKNASPDIITASRLLDSGGIAQIQDENFNTTKIVYNALKKDGKADAELFVVQESNGKVLGKADPQIEVLCKTPSIGHFYTAQNPTNKGDPVSLTPSPLQDNGCSLFYTAKIYPKDKTGQPSLEPTCGTPINGTRIADDDAGYPVWKFTSLPIKLDTANCPNTESLSIKIQSNVAGKLFPQSSVPVGDEDSTTAYLEKNDTLSGTFTVVSATYTLPGYDGVRYSAEAVALITPDPTDIPNVTKFCVKVNPNGSYGPGGAYQYGGVDYENEETLRDFCAPYGGAPGSGPCGNWYGNKLAIGNGYLIQHYTANDPTNLSCAFPGDAQICTLAGGLVYLKPFTTYTFKARRATSKRPCNR